jgi:hypothetical protein
LGTCGIKAAFGVISIHNIPTLNHLINAKKFAMLQREAWKFLYRNRPEARYWNALEQDRVMMENMEPDANQRENLYDHDVGLARLHRHMQNLAKKQLTEQLNEKV